jgi:hypothetical protein
VSLGASDKIMLGIGLIGFGGIFIWIGIALRLAYTKMDLMLSHLKNCPAVMIRVFLINTGPWGRLHVFGLIMGLMVMPYFFLRDGGASTEDLKNFPEGLKRKLVVLQWAGWLLLLAMFGLVAVDEFILG